MDETDDNTVAEGAKPTQRYQSEDESDEEYDFGECLKVNDWWRVKDRDLTVMCACSHSTVMTVQFSV